MPYNPAVTAGPLDYSYGIDFDYSSWPIDAEITLCNVRWDSAYRSVVDFRNRAALNAFIDAQPNKLVLPNYSQVRPFEECILDIPHNIASRYNYIRVSSPAQPMNAGSVADVQKDFYYFNNAPTYESSDATRLNLQLDVYQTYMYDVSFGNCYIERGHIGIANSNNFSDYGRRFLTVPEGLDIGGEYQVISDRSNTVMGLDIVESGGSLQFVDNTCVIIVTTQDITVDPGTKDDPNRETSKGSYFQMIASGATYWGFKTQEQFKNWMTTISATPWVGESVVTAFLAPNLSRYTTGFVWNENGPTDLNGYIALPAKYDLFNAWRDNAEILNQIPAQYRHLRKFFTYPYMLIELTTWTGTPIIMKPELWANANARIVERAAMVAPGQRIDFRGQSYNALPGAPINNWGDLPDEIIDRLPAGVRNLYRDSGDDHGDFWDHATKISNLPTVVMVNDAATSVIASQAHSLAYQRQSAQWDASKALAGNRNSYDNVSSGMQLASDLNAISMQNNLLQTGNTNRTQVASAITDGVSSTLSGLVGGGYGVQNIGIGALSSAIQQGGNAVKTGIDIAARDEATALTNLASSSSVNASNTNTGEIRDRNKSLADWAATGDYAQAIAGINAKVLDINMVAPNTSGQAGGDMMNLTNNEFKISARWKILDATNLKRVGDFWLRFGYAINQFVNVTDQLVMEKFTYWKMTECYLVTGPIPEVMKDTLRAIFEKGVTVYASPTDIGTVSIYNNPAKTGIVL